MRPERRMKVLAIDDDTRVLDDLTVGLQLQWDDAAVLRAADAEAGLRLFYDHDPDMVLLEVGLPGRSGFEVLREMRRVSDVPVMLLSERTSDIDQVRGFELGADDYVVKPFSFLVLLARVKALLRRARLPAPVHAQPGITIGDLTINFDSHHVALKGQPVRLTPLEFKLLYHLVRNAGRLMPHQTLLDRVWGNEYGATTQHLKVFINRLRMKIELPEAPPLIETERGMGYRFSRPRECY